MKKVLRNTVMKKINIDVVYECIASYEEYEVAASDMFDENDTRNVSEDKAMVDFHDFLLNIQAALNSYNFEVVNENWSNRTSSKSYYFDFYPTDSEDETLTRFMIHLRVSDHFKQNTKRSFNYIRKIAQENSKTEDGNQKFRFKTILINNRNYKSYNDALEFIYSMCENLQKGDYSNV